MKKGTFKQQEKPKDPPKPPLKPPLTKEELDRRMEALREETARVIEEMRIENERQGRTLSDTRLRREQHEGSLQVPKGKERARSAEPKKEIKEESSSSSSSSSSDLTEYFGSDETDEPSPVKPRRNPPREQKQNWRIDHPDWKDSQDKDNFPPEEN
ncbi:hypothetical protein VKT23_016371 [Stygiomarasmius scandens]|uniref:CWF21 domain-containing protein n=1 Tax=Marasmiellus scandens TaxID=2682957 RepID=A0ABR1IUM7_9AGAR